MTLSTSTRTTLRAAGAGAALTTLGLALVAGPASAATDASSDAAAGYLARRLAASDDRFQSTSEWGTFDDLGLTIDAVIGMAGARTTETQAKASSDYVLAHQAEYNTYGEDVYANSTAKLLTFLAVRGQSTGAVVTQLQSLEKENGQFADKSAWGDYSNTLGQSFALIGLKRAGVNPTQASIDFLLAQQCTDNGFSLTYEEGCVSDPDATSLAIQALTAVGRGGSNEVAQAANYLVSKQAATGGVSGGTTTTEVNSNSTGLAAAAFRITGKTEAARKARAYVTGLQFGCEFPAALRGGIAYTAEAYAERAKEGAAAKVNAQDDRATAQAVLALIEPTYVDVTSSGASATAPELTCASSSTTTTSTTTSTSPSTSHTSTVTSSTGTSTGPGSTSTTSSTTASGAVTTTPATPRTPSVVQTDGPAPSATPALALMGGGMALLAGAAVLTRRLMGRRAGAHQ